MSKKIDMIENENKELNNTIQQKTMELIELIGKTCKTCNTECSGGRGNASDCERWSHIIH